MIRITKTQKEKLEKAGLIKYRIVKNGIEVQSANLYVANKEHMSRSKTYYVVEEPKIMAFLGFAKKSKHYRQKSNKNNFNKAKLSSTKF